MLTVSDKFCKRTIKKIKNTIESIAKQTEKSIFVHELAQKQMPISFERNAHLIHLRCPTHFLSRSVK